MLRLAFLSALLTLSLAAQSRNDRAVPLHNWSAPTQIRRSQIHAVQSSPSPKQSQLPGDVNTDSLVFVPLAPCRVADTRVGSGFPGLGSTPLTSLTPRNLQIAGVCGVEATKVAFPGPEAYSLNVTVVPPGGNVGGYLLVYPNPAMPIPLVASMTWNPGASYQSNAVVAAASSDGSVNVVANATTDVVIDINGYYAAPSSSLGNTALGIFSLSADTSGVGNTAFGTGALQLNTSGGQDTAVGYAVLFDNVDGANNTAVGYSAMELANDGSGTLNQNIAIGSMSLGNIAGGNDNIAVGYQAMMNSSTGNQNTAIGSGALGGSSGGFNIALGYQAGSQLTTGSSNIMIGSGGTSSDNNIIRMGVEGVQTSTFIAGISGVTVAGGSPVFVNSSGQLGVELENLSSARYKEDIHDMGDSSDGLLKLRPVTFRYKKVFDSGSKPLQYGLIAEEVADVYPELVLRGKEGQVEGVQYQKLPALLLNELQKQYRHAEEQDRTAKEQAETIQKLEARLAALEAQLANATAKASSGEALASSSGGR
jgi:hypothetical protein